jgi:hypothetical protein
MAARAAGGRPKRELLATQQSARVSAPGATILIVLEISNERSVPPRPRWTHALMDIERTPAPEQTRRLLFFFCSRCSLWRCTRHRSAWGIACPTGRIAAWSCTAAVERRSFRCACWRRTAATGRSPSFSRDCGARNASARPRRSTCAPDIASTTMARRPIGQSSWCRRRPKRPELVFP